ncbi:MAG: hypothetical protein ABI867_28665 [Kofleriaceae bacterium]
MIVILIVILVVIGAVGRAMECVCSLDVMKVEETLTAEQYERGVELCERIVSLMTKAMQNQLAP